MTTVLAHGCFDLLHVGHIRFLRAARALGDRLVVSITADAFINKGPGHPLFNQWQRQEILLGLRDVDEVYVSYESTGVTAINTICPDIYAKGGDYANGDISGQLELERKAVEACRGKLVIVPGLQKFSSTTYIKRLHELERTV